MKYDVNSRRNDSQFEHAYRQTRSILREFPWIEAPTHDTVFKLSNDESFLTEVSISMPCREDRKRQCHCVFLNSYVFICLVDREHTW